MSRRGFAAGLLTQKDTDGQALPPPQDVETLSAVNFFDGFGDWTTPGTEDPAAGSWTRANSRTGLTGSIGPAGGAFPVTLVATEGQFFGFNESSGPFAGTFWSLESPAFDASLGLIALTFQVFMRFGVGGALNDGTLRVQGWNGTAWSNIGASIVGSQQTNSTDPFLPSDGFDDYDSGGFSNSDFRFRFLLERGSDPDTFNYDCALDNLEVVGPIGPGSPGTPPGSGGDPNGIIKQLSGEDGVDAYSSLGLNLNYPNPEQAHNRANISSPAARVFAGSRSLQTELRPGDPKANVDPSGTSKRRAEVSWRPFRYAGGVEGWFGAAFYLPSDPMAAVRGCTIFQLHNDPDAGEMLQVSVFAGQLQFVSDGPSTNFILPGGNINLASAGLLDQWVRIRCNFLPSTTGSGFIKIWLKDDVEASPRIDYSGPTKPSGSNGPYFKHGGYFWGAGNDPVKEALVLHDNLRIGDQTSDFASVDPNTFVRND